jgi:hypothetical protein
MPEPKDDVEQVIFNTLCRRSKGDPEALARAILESLWEAGYDVTRLPDMIPIRANPGEAPASPYAVEGEHEAQGLSPAELFQRLAEEPRNAPIQGKINEIARKFDGSC